MRHLEDEDIARMIEGKISKKERKNFLKHLSECDSCITVYTETFKFVEKERKRPTILKLPGIEKIKIPVQHLWQDIRDWLANKKPVLVPAFIVLIVVLVVGPFVLKELHEKSTENAKIQQIAGDIESMGSHAFSPSRDEISAAVRAGIFIEDLSLVVNAGGNEELKTKISKMLSNELKIMFKNETDSLFQDLENIEKKNFETVVQNIQKQIEKRPLSKLFGFGRFVELSILSTFENKRPQQGDIDKYQQILQKYKNKLPRGIFNQLKKLKPPGGIKESKKTFIAIKEIILSLE
jgi:hypothetical protein